MTDITPNAFWRQLAEAGIRGGRLRGVEFPGLGYELHMENPTTQSYERVAAANTLQDLAREVIEHG